MPRVLCIGFFAVLGITLMAGPHSALAADLQFNRDIRPILTEHCLACHGADEAAREADLRLDLRDVAISQKAIMPESPQQSELVRRILATDPDEQMPPPGHTELLPAQKAMLQTWIAEGAVYESHWAFIAPTSPSIPAVDPDLVKWTQNPIDNFVLRKLAAEQLAPAAKATRPALIRRLYLDLIGLPPNPQTVRAFVEDDAVNAYEKVVDELLASKHFGEHWARMWLDLARYADTKGYEKDNHRDIWRYREWVIRAFNADMPYTEFTREQLAGDLMPDATLDQIVATGFHRNTMTNDEGGTDDEEFRSLAVKDRVDTTMQVWMGLTMGCAKCHTHKYDPISQTEYYQFYAYFNQTEDADRSDEAPKLRTPTASEQQKLDAVQAEFTAAEQFAAGLAKDATLQSSAAWLVQKLKKEKQAAENACTHTPIMRELADDKHRKTHLHLRGNFLEPGDQVTAATPASFGSFASEYPNNRLGVAAWLLQEQNPLTARVAVNRIWARLFGRGMVETEEDFGTQGSYPSHPELLDWLAIEFRDSLGWSHKRLLKVIVSSATYQQSSVVSELAAQLDPQNRWYGRAPRFRLAAETVRDQALTVAGLLTPDLGGPSVMPPQPDGIWKTTYSKLKWKSAEGKERYRRGLYTYWRRTSPYPSMLTFDAGSREVCLIRRIRTNIPLQALVTMNDPVFVEASGAIAKQVVESDFSQNDHRIEFAFQRVLIRPLSADESGRLMRILEDSLAEFRADPNAAVELLKAARIEANGIEESELAAWTIVANVLLNLDETLMRN